MDLNNLPQSPILRVPAWVRIPMLIGSLGAAVATIFMNVGPFRWMTTVLNELPGRYHAILTVLSGLLTVLVFLIPVLVFVVLLAAILPNRAPNQPAHVQVKPQDRRVRHQAVATGSMALTRKLRRHRPLIVLTLSGVGLVCAGAYFLASSLRGELLACTIVEFNEPDGPPSRYVEITDAQLLWQDVRVIVRTRDGIESEHFYVPMVEASWVHGEPYRSFAHFTETSYQTALYAVSLPVRGTVARGLPGIAETTLRNRNMLDGPGWVVDYGRTTGELRTMGTALLVTGSVLGLTGLLFGTRIYLRRRRTLRDT